MKNGAQLSLLSRHRRAQLLASCAANDSFLLLLALHSSWGYFRKSSCCCLGTSRKYHLQDTLSSLLSSSSDTFWPPAKLTFDLQCMKISQVLQEVWSSLAGPACFWPAWPRSMAGANVSISGRKSNHFWSMPISTRSIEIYSSL